MEKNKRIPHIGLGTNRLNSLKDSVDIIKHAIKIGYRHLDSASIYNSEEPIGIAIKECIEEGIVKREDLFVTSKMWITERNEPEEALERSLKALQLDYVDLYLIHWPIGECHTGKPNVPYKPLHQIWPIFEGFVKAGKTKYIGVSNFNVQLLVDLLSYAEIKPFANEVEIHPYLTQKGLLEFLHHYEIIPIGYCPLFKFGFDEMHNLLNEPIIKELSEKYDKSTAQIVLNWELYNGVVPIPKSANPDRLKENLESDTFKMENEDYLKIDSLNCGRRRCTSNHPGINCMFDIFA